MKPLKDIYTTPSIFRQLAKDMKAVYPALNEQQYYKALIKNLSNLELMARVKQAGDVSYTFLPNNYAQAIKVLYRFCEGKKNTFIYLFLPYFVAKYGTDDYARSIKAIRDFTQYSSSEDGVRTYISLDLKRTLKEMQRWTQSSNNHIRRLASEGCRPRLPWAKKIPELIESPKHTWPILDQLKADSDKYVQKSVANHINDISKDHPDWIVNHISAWDQSNSNTQWIIKHGMRTLLKQGHKGALKLFGFDKKPKINFSNIQWTKKVALGSTFTFSLDLMNASNTSEDYLIDYSIHFLKKSGQLNPKVFKLTKVNLNPKESTTLKAKYAFKDYSTRKHYTGQHAWQLLINGTAFDIQPFNVISE